MVMVEGEESRGRCPDGFATPLFPSRTDAGSRREIEEVNREDAVGNRPRRKCYCRCELHL